MKKCEKTAHLQKLAVTGNRKTSKMKHRTVSKTVQKRVMYC